MIINQNTAVLQSCYFPNIQYISKLLIHKNIQLEIYDTYAKQTYRNRFEIYSPNGIQALSIPVEKIHGSKTMVKDILISQKTNWQDNHLKSIITAYKSSPFFEFYIDEFTPFFKKKYFKLIDLNTEILNKTIELLELENNITYTTKYNSIYPIDYRDTIHPKKQTQKHDSTFLCATYHQTFESKFGFIKNLSILDLIFNEGPMSYFILKNSISNIPKFSQKKTNLHS